MKKVIKKTAHGVIRGSKKTLDKFPKTKSRVRNVLSKHVDFGTANNEELNYKKWVLANYPNGGEIYKQREASNNFTYKPKISIITPIYNTNHKYLRSCIESVQGQSYENWELCLVDDASSDEQVREIMKEYASADSRIVCTYNKKNLHISGASNVAAKKATGEFLAILDHDDILWPNALYEVVKKLNEDKTIDFFYSDEDKIGDNDYDFQNPFFKPDWNPDFLHSVNYITHFSAFRKSIFMKVGMFNSKYDGAQDWDLFMRITSETNKIFHIPKILYSWRMSETSTAQNMDSKPYVIEAQKNAISDDLKRKNHKGFSVYPDKVHFNYWNVEYKVKNKPLISIVIPSKNQYQVFRRCIESILSKTTYDNYEIVIVDTGSNDPKVTKWYEELSKNKKIKIEYWKEQAFSYSKSCNYGASKSNGSYLVMLNNDTEIQTKNWLELLLGYAQRDEAGAVGCKLLYPGNKLIQHAGIGIGLGGVAANILSQQPELDIEPTQHLYMHTTHNVSAVTAACLMIKKDKFDVVGGFDETLRITYNDVDLCLRLHEKGLQNVYLSQVRVIHHESISVGMPNEKNRDNPEFQEATELFKKRWGQFIISDPNLNPNFERTNANLQVKNML